MSKEILTAKIYRNFVNVTYNEFEQKVVKNISLDDFRNLFTEYTVSTPLLPMWIVAYKEGNNTIGLMTCRQLDGGVMDMEMTGNNHLNLHLPFIYFRWKINKGNNQYRITESGCYVSYGAPHPDTKIYVPAIPNVYENSNICWGNNSRDIHQSYPVGDLSFIKQAENTFFIGIHTYHLVSQETVDRANDIIYTTEEDWRMSPIVRQGRTGIKLQNFIADKI